MHSRPVSLEHVRSGHRGAGTDTSSWTALVAKVKQCGHRKDLPGGKRLHMQAIEAGCHNNRYVAHSLITMYSKCGSMKDAMDVFQNMLQHDVVSWNSLIIGYVDNGECLLALEVFISMDCARDSFTFVAALKACAGLASEKHSDKQACLEKGMAVHKQAKEQGLDTHVFVANSLIDMYSKNGSMRNAREAFERIIHPGAVSWNSLMFGYVENGKSPLTLEMFTRMDCAPNKLTFVAALKACASLATDKVLDKKLCLEKGMVIHKQAREAGCEKEIFVANTLIDMYSKCGSMRDARNVFDNMIQHDTVSWNSLMLGYVENGECSAAFDMFTSMDCAPEAITFVAVLKACAGLVNGKEDRRTCLLKGTAIHIKARECGFHRRVFVANSLVDMYGRCGSMRDAQNVFDDMIEHDVFSWNSLMLGYVENSQLSVALDVFASMDCALDSFTFAAAIKSCASLASENQLDMKACLSKGLAIHSQARERGFDKHIFVATTLVDMYGKCGSMRDARDVFEKMLERDVVSWNSLMLGYVDNREFSMALDVFSGMDCVPDSLTFVVAFQACAGLAAEKQSDKKACLMKGMGVHVQARGLGFDRDLLVENALIDMYSKCGSMRNAEEVFGSMVQRDVVSWNSLIVGYVENGECLIALDVYANMDYTPDNITFVALLKACINAGALEIGYRVHSRICELGLEQQEMVATSLMDFYGKCGNMLVAEEVFNIMHSPDIVSWTALLGGYSSLGNTSQVFSVVKRIQEADMQMNSVTYQLILTACSHAGMVEEGRKYFNSMSKYDVSRTVEHYTCMVDMLGRANKLQEAFSVIKSMPFEGNSHVWITLLGACRKWGSLEVGRIAFHELVTHSKNEEELRSAYILMRDIYWKLGMQQEELQT